VAGWVTWFEVEAMGGLVVGMVSPAKEGLLPPCLIQEDFLSELPNLL